MTRLTPFDWSSVRYRTLLIGLWLISAIAVGAQDVSLWSIERIEVKGNERTKEAYILREVPAKVGDEITSWTSFREECRNLLLNTGLFNNVWVYREVSSHTLTIEVKEALYILPVPIVELADRNFNEWWVTHNASLRRLNYGLTFYHNNLSGRSDQLKATFLLGFNQKLQLSYEFPFLDHQLRWQPYMDVLFARQAGVAVNTINDRQQWMRVEGARLLQRFRARAGLRYRPGFRSFWTGQITYFDRSVDPLLLEENPFFLGDHQKQQKFLAASFQYLGEYRDRPIYPMQGWRLKTELTAQGLLPQDDLHTIHVELHSQYLKPLSYNSSLSFSLYGRYFVSGGDDLPFYNQRGMGYGAVFPRSYEYQVIDGPDYILGKTDFKWRWLSHDWNWGSLMFIEALRCMPLESFVNVFIDWGYVNGDQNSEFNSLPNQHLLGYGIGIDVLAYENFLFQIQYSRGIHQNQGIFIHLTSSY